MSWCSICNNNSLRLYYERWITNYNSSSHIGYLYCVCECVYVCVCMLCFIFLRKFWFLLRSKVLYSLLSCSHIWHPRIHHSARTVACAGVSQEPIIVATLRSEAREGSTITLKWRVSLLLASTVVACVNCCCLRQLSFLRQLLLNAVADKYLLSKC